MCKLGETLTRCRYLLNILEPDECPGWIEGVGDCGKPDCIFCQIESCLQAIDEIQEDE